MVPSHTRRTSKLHLGALQYVMYTRWHSIPRMIDVHKWLMTINRKWWFVEWKTPKCHLRKVVGHKLLKKMLLALARDLKINNEQYSNDPCKQDACGQSICVDNAYFVILICSICLGSNSKLLISHQHTCHVCQRVRGSMEGLHWVLSITIEMLYNSSCTSLTYFLIQDDLVL